MNQFIIQFIIKLIFAFGLAIVFTQCGSEDQAREAATKAALENPSPEQKATPGQKPALPATTAGTLGLSATGKTTTQGSEACIAVTTRDFREIVSMQYTMKWDPKVLKYVGVKSFGLPGMSPQNFGSQEAAKGLLTYSWYDTNVRGITQPDGFKLYDVCFAAVGESGTKSYFQFSNAPTIIEITNAASQFLDLSAESGVVMVR